MHLHLDEGCAGLEGKMASLMGLAGEPALGQGPFILVT